MERSETVHVVMRRKTPYAGEVSTPVRVADDRKDAREYAKTMNAKSPRWYYFVRPCKKL